MRKMAVMYLLYRVLYKYLRSNDPTFIFKPLRIPSTAEKNTQQQHFSYIGIPQLSPL